MSKQNAIEGRLCEFREMGRGGVIWSVTAEKAAGSEEEKIYALKDGDLLTVFNDASRKSILWEGEIRIAPIKGAAWPDAYDCQEGETLEKWHDMFNEQRPATVTLKGKREPLSW